MREKEPANARDDDDYYLTLAELSRYSTLSVRTLWRYIKTADLPHVHVRAPGKAKGRIFVGKRAFNRWMERFRVGGPRDSDDPNDFGWIKTRH